MQNKYFILQHGGGYLCKYHSSHELELKTSDVFYSWGKPIAKNEKQFNSPHIKNFVNISKLLDDKIIIPLYFPRKYSFSQVFMLRMLPKPTNQMMSPRIIAAADLETILFSSKYILSPKN